MASAAAPATAPATAPPVAIVCVGMAGSGKTTFMQRINSHLHANNTPPYVMNLDPAVRKVPFEPNIDVRDSVNYREVMKQYNLGPNGGIITSLNLFATKIDQVLAILEKRCLPQPPPANNADAPSAPPPPSSSSSSAPSTPAAAATPHHILVDTPGQIEVFVWSASGSILLSSLASSFPTVLAYVIDTPRTTSSAATFMSNMLYAISILYKTKLPMILVFNKTDVKPETEALEWMRDFEAFQAAVQREEEEHADTGTGGSGYMGSLLNSMSMVLEEFYNNLSVVGVSSMTGAGASDFFDAVELKRQEFERDYRPELNRRREEREKEKEARREKDVSRMMKDMAMGNNKPSSPNHPETVSDVEEDDQDGELLERDDDDEQLDDYDNDDSLARRYRAALKDGPTASMSNEDASFAKYVQTAKFNR